jgi:hypothetical protein
MTAQISHICTVADGIAKIRPTEHKAVLRAAVPHWLTTLCDQWQTQMRLQRPAERQALADGNPLGVTADLCLEAQPRSAGSSDASQAPPSGRQLSTTLVVASVRGAICGQVVALDVQSPRPKRRSDDGQTILKAAVEG